jgi:hypothetical protein
MAYLSRNDLDMLPGLSIFVAFRIGIGSRLRSTIMRRYRGILEKRSEDLRGFWFLRTGNSSSQRRLLGLLFDRASEALSPFSGAIAASGLCCSKMLAK